MKIYTGDMGLRTSWKLDRRRIQRRSGWVCSYREEGREGAPDTVTAGTSGFELTKRPFGSSVNMTSSARASARMRFIFVINWESESRTDSRNQRFSNPPS